MFADYLTIQTGNTAEDILAAKEVRKGIYATYNEIAPISPGGTTGDVIIPVLLTIENVVILSVTNSNGQTLLTNSIAVGTLGDTGIYPTINFKNVGSSTMNNIKINFAVFGDAE